MGQQLGPKNSGHAVAALVLGIAAIVMAICCWPIGIVLGILGVVFGFLGKNQIDREPALYRGRGMAMAGLICGFVGLGLAVLLIILWATNVATWNWDYDSFQSLGSLGGLT